MPPGTRRWSLPLRSALLVATLAVGLVSARSGAAAGLDLLVEGGAVWTGVGATTEPRLASVLIRDGSVSAVGDPAAVARQAGPRCRRLDASGCWVVPGFHDAHTHLVDGALSLEQLDLDQAGTLEDVQRALRGFAAVRSDPWIYGRGWKYDLFSSGQEPSRALLDAVVPDRPVYLESYDGHAAWVNSAALRRAGIGPATPDPADGRFAREADGVTPTGYAIEGACTPLAEAVDKPTEAQRTAALKRAFRKLLDQGVTSLTTMETSTDSVKLLEHLYRTGQVPVRVSVRLPLETDLDEVERMRRRLGGAWLRIGGVKGFVDGVVESRTAALIRPYSPRSSSTSSGPAAGRGGEEDARGVALFDRGRLGTAVGAAHQRGLSVALHCVGDGAVRLALDAIQDVQKRLGPGPRHRIEHIELMARADAARFAALGVGASMQPLHSESTEPGGGIWSRQIGARRSLDSFDFRSLFDAGAAVLFGSDWPVAQPTPLAAIGAALARTRGSAARLSPHLTPGEALLASVRGAEELAPDFGSTSWSPRDPLSPGSPGDLVLIPILENPGEARGWRNSRVRATVVGGQVHEPRP